jgi:glycosyltransferase involved in cell wall biosynthesis
MAEVTAVLAPALEEELRPFLSFAVGPRAADEIADKLVAWLSLDDTTRERAATALAKRAAARFGWESVARGVLSAALGRLDDLPAPTDKVPPP